MSNEGAFFLACVACAAGIWLGARGKEPPRTCPDVTDLQSELQRVESRLQSSERLREVVVEEVLKGKLAPHTLARAVRRTQ